MDRREFVLAAALTAAAPSLRWLRSGGMFQTIASADTTTTVSSETIFDGVVRAFLPSDDSRFASIAPAAVADRADRLFSLDQDTAIQQNLVLFDDLTQFVAPPPGVVQLEPVLFPPSNTERNVGAAVAARIARDANAYQVASGGWAGRALFTDLNLAGQRAYLMLWARSALGVRRRFYRSMKTLVMAATYSMDQVWPIIGYAGPLLHLHRNDEHRD
jgi:hypothetical protein